MEHHATLSCLPPESGHEQCARASTAATASLGCATLPSLHQRPALSVDLATVSHSCARFQSSRMAAARFRQAASRLASAATSAAASAASTGSPGRRAAGLAVKTLALGTAVGAWAYEGQERALVRRVPYGLEGGRERGPCPLWAAWLGGWRAQPLGHATTTLVAQQGYPEVLEQVRGGECASKSHVPLGGEVLCVLCVHRPCNLLGLALPPSLQPQLGPDGLQPVPAGEVRVHWILPGGSAAAAAEGDQVCQAPVRQAVEECMQAVYDALRQEAAEKEFGTHVLVSGLALSRAAGREHGLACLPLAPHPCSAGISPPALDSS